MKVGGFRRPRFLPRAQDGYLGLRQAALADEAAVTGLRRPRRHVPARRDLHNLPCTLARIVEGQERERAWTGGVVARRTAPIENRSDIPRKGWSGGNVCSRVPRAALTNQGEQAGGDHRCAERQRRSAMMHPTACVSRRTSALASRTW